MRTYVLKIIAFVFIFVTCFSVLCFAYEDNQYVKVRVRSPRQYNEKVQLTGYDDICVYNDSNDKLTEMFQTESDLNILMDSYYDENYNYLGEELKNSASIGPYHVRISDLEFSSYDEAKDKAYKLKEDIKEDIYPFFDGLNYELYIGSFISDESSSEVLGKLKDLGLSGKTVNDNHQNSVVFNKDNEIIFMYSKNYNIFFTSENNDLNCNMIKIDGKQFRGMIGFYIINNSKMISINLIDLESYLYGVVPNEISASWPIEAVKAQAVAARTYAVSSIDMYIYYGYDLDDNQNSQVYRGYLSECKTSNEAVDETKGKMIYYDGKLIEAFYHSTSGGSTEDSENVWYDKRPYLRGVDDEYSNISPKTEWEVNYTKKDIINKLNSAGNDVKDLYGIEITKVSDNHRVLECIFDTDKGKITYEKEDTRLVLGLDSQWFTINNNIGSNIYYFTNKNMVNVEKDNTDSILDSITEKDDNNDNENRLNSENLDDKYIITESDTEKLNNDEVAFIDSTGISMKQTVNLPTSDYHISGRGWGHGIGLSQYGAKEMAVEGFKYEEILKHYYTGVNIK